MCHLHSHLKKDGDQLADQIDLVGVVKMDFCEYVLGQLFPDNSSCRTLVLANGEGLHDVMAMVFSPWVLTRSLEFQVKASGGIIKEIEYFLDVSKFKVN